jgi:serine/threonine-protein kinase
LLPWGAAAVLAGLLAVSLWAPWQTTPPADPPIQLRVELGPETSLFADYGAATIISPQGDRIVYVEGGGTLPRNIYLRNLDQLEPRVISGSEEGYHPFFSPDGQWVGFVTREKLKKVSAFGGTPISLADISLSRGASWGPDGTIVFAPSPSSGLMRMPAAGGEPEALTELDESSGETTHRWPHYLPGGKALLFTVHDAGVGFDDARIELLEIESGQRKILHRGGSYARYVPTGHVVFVRESTLYAMPFDLDRLEVSGTPFPVLEGITSNPVHGSAQFDFSNTGIFVYSSGSSVNRMAKVMGLEQDGKAVPLLNDVVEYYAPRYAPDGERLAVSVGAFDDADIWVVDLRRGTRTRLTFSDKSEWRPIWSADGISVAFASARNGIPNIYSKPADGSSEAVQLTDSQNVQVPTSWSSDGRYILFSELSSDNGWDLHYLDIQEGETRPLIETKFHQVSAVFSPDGKWTAYMSNDSGRMEVYVRPFPGPGGKWQISTAGGNWPRWSADGKEIFYRSADDKLMSVPVNATGGGFTAGNPELLVDVSDYLTEFFGSYDVVPGTRRFVVLEASENQGDAPDRSKVNIVLNWFQQLERMATSSTN